MFPRRCPNHQDAFEAGYEFTGEREPLLILHCGRAADGMVPGDTVAGWITKAVRVGVSDPTRVHPSSASTRRLSTAPPRARFHATARSMWSVAAGQ